MFDSCTKKILLMLEYITSFAPQILCSYYCREIRSLSLALAVARSNSKATVATTAPATGQPGDAFAPTADLLTTSFAVLSLLFLSVDNAQRESGSSAFCRRGKGSIHTLGNSIVVGGAICKVSERLLNHQFCLVSISPKHPSVPLRASVHPLS